MSALGNHTRVPPVLFRTKHDGQIRLVATLRMTAA